MTPENPTVTGDTPVLADRLVDEAKAAINDRRYGSLTNPFVLGLLTAAEIVRTLHQGEDDEDA